MCTTSGSRKVFPRDPITRKLVTQLRTHSLHFGYILPVSYDDDDTQRRWETKMTRTQKHLPNISYVESTLCCLMHSRTWVSCDISSGYLWPNTPVSSLTSVQIYFSAVRENIPGGITREWTAFNIVQDPSTLCTLIVFYAVEIWQRIPGDLIRYPHTTREPVKFPAKRARTSFLSIKTTFAVYAMHLM